MDASGAYLEGRWQRLLEEAPGWEAAGHEHRREVSRSRSRVRTRIARRFAQATAVRPRAVLAPDLLGYGEFSLTPPARLSIAIGGASGSDS